MEDPFLYISWHHSAENGNELVFPFSSDAFAVKNMHGVRSVYIHIVSANGNLVCTAKIAGGADQDKCAALLTDLCYLKFANVLVEKKDATSSTSKSI